MTEDQIFHVQRLIGEAEGNVEKARERLLRSLCASGAVRDVVDRRTDLIMAHTDLEALRSLLAQDW